MNDCRECQHSKQSYGKLLCLVLNTPRPVEFMRDPRSECGHEGSLFEAKGQRYAEFDDV